MNREQRLNILYYNINVNFLNVHAKYISDNSVTCQLCATILYKIY